MQEKPVFLEPMRHSTLGRRFLTPFYAEYQVLDALEKEPPSLRDALRELVLSHDYRFLYLRNQKCASTLTVQLLYAWGAGGETYPGDIHRANSVIIPARYRWLDIKPIHEAHMSYLFTFVRNPEARLISAFRDLFLEATDIDGRLHYKAMKAHGYDPDRDAGYNFDVFLDYVAHSLELDRHATDRHWRMQVDNIGWREIDYDFIGRVENFAADIAQVFQAGGAGDFPPPGLIAPSGTEPALDITPGQRARIRQLYAADYEAFGYPV